MNRKLKTLTLIVSAAMATIALLPATASAVNFHTETGHSVIVGSDVGGGDVFTFKAGTLKCGNISYSGTASSATFEVMTVVVSFQECTAFGFINTPVDSNFCEYRFWASSNFFDIRTCVPPITITAFNCWVTVDAQNWLEGLTFKNGGAGSGRYIEIATNVTGIKYTQHSKSFPGCTNGTFTDGKYTGLTTLTSINTSAEPKGLWRE
jgi:hypothetical protein